MKIGIFVSDTGGERTGVEELLRRAQWVEENGFTSAWVPAIPWSLDALTALALASTVTNHIELGTAVVPTYPRHPLALAQQALSVQAASNGRLTLGIGPTHPPEDLPHDTTALLLAQTASLACRPTPPGLLSLGTGR